MVKFMKKNTIEAPVETDPLLVAKDNSETVVEETGPTSNVIAEETIVSPVPQPQLDITMPTIGRVVVFKDRATGKSFPALVSEVIDESTYECHICVLDPAGIHFIHALPGDESGNWKWPTRA